MKEIKELIKSILPEVTELRHTLHSIPEIGFSEFKTSEFIRSYLAGIGVETAEPFLGTEVTAFIKGNGENLKTILLRADMDALPITEDTGLPYSSGHPGFAHSCGHDGHVAVLLGTAAVLSRLREKLNCNVQFLFQPAEESVAGGKTLTEAGYLDKYRVDEAYALHGWPGEKVGFIRFCRGPIMAYTEDFEIVLTGAGGHGAMPHLACDLIHASSRFIAAMKDEISVLSEPEKPAVFSVCSINGGSAFNVIPGRLVLKGTARYLYRETGLRIDELMHEYLDRFVTGIGGKYEILHPLPNYAATFNDPELCSYLEMVSGKYAGKENSGSDAVCSMCGDDFGFFLEKVPGVYFRLGMGENHSSLHSNSYDFEDGALENGISVMCGIILEQKQNII